MRRILPVLGLCALAFAVDSQPASAEITYPWCAQYSGGGDGAGAARNCGFWTYEQCSATVSGIGGYCEVNAMYQGPSPGMIPPPYQIRPGPPGAKRRHVTG
jgi:hypothetical protein